MIVFTENAETPKMHQPRNPNSSVQIQIKIESQFEFVPRDNEKSEFLDLVDFVDAAFVSYHSVISTTITTVYIYVYLSIQKIYIWVIWL